MVRWAGVCPNAAITETNRTANALHAIFVDNFAPDNRCDSLALERPAMKRRIPAARPRLIYIEAPTPIHIQNGQIRGAAFEQTPGLDLHDLLRIQRKQFDQPIHRKLQFRQSQTYCSFESRNSKRSAIEFEHLKINVVRRVIA